MLERQLQEGKTLEKHDSEYCSLPGIRTQGDLSTRYDVILVIVLLFWQYLLQKYIIYFEVVYSISEESKS